MENDKKENSEKVKEKVDDTENLENAEDAKNNNVLYIPTLFTLEHNKLYNFFKLKLIINK